MRWTTAQAGALVCSWPLDQALYGSYFAGHRMIARGDVAPLTRGWIILELSLGNGGREVENREWLLLEKEGKFQEAVEGCAEKGNLALICLSLCLDSLFCGYSSCVVVLPVCFSWCPCMSVSVVWEVSDAVVFPFLECSRFHFHPTGSFVALWRNSTL